MSDIGAEELQLFKPFDDRLEISIQSFINPDGSLNGKAMTADWFPQVKPDIFISHSRKNMVPATAFAAFVKREFGLTAFIDGLVWKHSDKLIKMIDQQFNPNPAAADYYSSRNQSTSHVHMMLVTALCEVIDNSECLIFLNTPDSITPRETIIATESPWIYAEIAMSRLIRQRSKESHREETRTYTQKSLDESFQKPFIMKHEVALDHLTSLNFDDMVSWYNVAKGKTKFKALDLLYDFGTFRT